MPPSTTHQRAPTRAAEQVLQMQKATARHLQYNGGRQRMPTITAY